MLKRLVAVTIGLFIATVSLAAQEEPVIILTPTQSSATGWDDGDIDTVSTNAAPQEPVSAALPPKASFFEESSVKKPQPAAASLSVHHVTHKAQSAQYYGPTTSKDDIWQIALKVRPNATISVAQMAVALLHANPQSFIDNNVNGLKTGQKLRVPDLAAIQSVPSDRAQRLVIAQNVDWQKTHAPKENVAKSDLFVNQPQPANKPVSAPMTTKTVIDVAPTKVPIQATAATTPAPTTNNLSNLIPIVTHDTTQAPAKSETVVKPQTQPSTTAAQPMVATNQPTPTANHLTDVIPIIANNQTATKPNVGVAKPQVEQAVVTAPSQPSSPTITTATKPAMPAAVSVGASYTESPQLTALEGQLKAAQQELANYKKTTDMRMNDLVKQNSSTQVHVSQVEKALLKLSEDVTHLAKQFSTSNTFKNISLEQPTKGLTILPKSRVGWWILWAVVLLIVFIWMPWSKITTPKKPVSNHHPVSEDDDYDYLNSSEAIPAKLDLARAYIDMEDVESATKVLQEVLLHGNDNQRHQAKTLLGNIRPHLV